MTAGRKPFAALAALAAKGTGSGGWLRRWWKWIAALVLVPIALYMIVLNWFIKSDQLRAIINEHP